MADVTVVTEGTTEQPTAAPPALLLEASEIGLRLGQMQAAMESLSSEVQRTQLPEVLQSILEAQLSPIRSELAELRSAVATLTVLEVAETLEETEPETETEESGDGVEEVTIPEAVPPPMEVPQPRKTGVMTWLLGG